MLSKLLEFVSQRGYKQEVKRLQVVVDQINGIEEGLQNLSDDELRAKTVSFRQHIRSELAPYEEEVEKVRRALEGEQEKITNDQLPITNQIQNPKSKAKTLPSRPCPFDKLRTRARHLPLPGEETPSTPSTMKRKRL